MCLNLKQGKTLRTHLHDVTSSTWCLTTSPTTVTTCSWILIKQKKYILNKAKTNQRNPQNQKQAKKLNQNNKTKTSQTKNKTEKCKEIKTNKKSQNQTKNPNHQANKKQLQAIFRPLGCCFRVGIFSVWKWWVLYFLFV